MGMHSIRWIGAAVICVLLGCLIGCAGPSSNEILIGEFGSLTGPTATFGQSTQAGIDLAIEEINAKGGVLNKHIKVMVEDDRGDAAEAKSAVTRLITNDRVVAVLGEVASKLSLAGAPVCQANKIPMVTPSSTNVEVTQKGDYIFRVCFIDPFQGYVMAKFARDHLKAQRAAIFYDIKNDYSKGLAEVFDSEFKKMGGEIVITESYQAGDSDFLGQLSKIRNTNPDVLYIPGYYTEVGLIGRQAREAGIKPEKCTLLGGDGWDSETLFEQAQGSLEGCYYSNHFSIENKDPMVQAFIKKFKKNYKKTPDAMAALGYDAARILIEAIAQAQSLEGAKIRDALAMTKDFPGVTGSITIDKNRNASKPAVVLEIKGNVAKYVTTIEPPDE
jgi:branched-chain amino acid transport system substrate-binding protein